MGSTARTASEDGMVKCERCEAPYEVRGEEGRARKRLTCASCGHSQDAWVLPVVGRDKWTLVDPAGAVTTFASWGELLTALRNSGITAVHPPTSEAAKEKSDPPKTASAPPPRSMSASALLHQTPQPGAMRSKVAAIAPRTEEAAGALPAGARTAKAKGERKPGDEWDEDVEMISLRDLQVVVPPPAPPAPPARGSLRTLPPAAGSDAPPPPSISVEEIAALAAPSVPDLSALEGKQDQIETLDDRDVEPAPPTQRTPDSVAAQKAATAEETAEKVPAAAKKAERDRDEAKVVVAAEPESPKAPKSKTTPSRASQANTMPPTRARKAAPAPEPELDTRNWLVPVAAIAMAAAGIAYAMYSTPDAAKPDDKPVATVQQPQPQAVVTATPTAQPVKPAETVAPAETNSTTPVETVSVADLKPATAEAKPAAKPEEPPTTAVTTPAPRPKPADADGRLTMPEQLEAAGKARRAGDMTRARELYGRVLGQSPGNVEAYNGLGAIARQQGDLAAAKDNYQKAVSASPGFYPAVLGLADVEWELGEKDAAQRHYQQVLKSAPTPPDRARERSGTQ